MLCSSQFPTYAKVFTRLGKIRSLPSFGLAFGWRQPQPPASGTTTGQEQRKELQTVKAAITGPAPLGTSINASAANPNVADQKPLASQQSAVTPLKRPSATATSYHVTSEEPLIKRPRLAGSPPSVIAMTSMSNQAVSTI